MIIIRRFDRQGEHSMAESGQKTPTKAKKEKLTLAQKLAKRKYKKPNRFIVWLYHFIMIYLVAPKYKPHYKRGEGKDDLRKCDGPCFLIWNHLSRLDHLYLMQLAYPRPINIVCGYNEFFRSHLAAVFKLNQVVPKKIFTQDMNGIRAMHSIVKQGGCLAFSPEGMSSIYGTNQPIVPGTGRFIQSFGIPVYMARLRGSYLTSTKICLDERQGRSESEAFLLYSAEQLAEMTPQEIEDGINEAFRSDDYEWGLANNLHWKNNGKMASQLDTVLYRCPVCHSEFTIGTEGNDVFCTACGMRATVDDMYRFNPHNPGHKLPLFPSHWVREERGHMISEIRADRNWSYTEEMEVGCLLPYKLVPKKYTTIKCGRGALTVDHAGIHFDGTRDGNPWHFDLSYKVIYSLIVMTDTTRFALYVNGEFVEFFPSRPCVGRVLLAVEEMHRLHVNDWKNFPWTDDLYAPYTAATAHLAWTDAENPADKPAD